MKRKTFVLKEMKMKYGWLLIFLLIAGSCSSVKESGEPDNAVPDTPEVITNDAQRKAIYESGGNVSPQNANPIPSSRDLGLNERSSEINRKRNIEDGANTNAPATVPTDERARQIRNTGSGMDTIRR